MPARPEYLNKSSRLTKLTTLRQLFRFLSRTSELSKKAFEDFGSKPLLLVVDDAHDRQDLPLLFQFLASRQPSAKVLLALRPYGLEHLKAQASEFGLMDTPTVIDEPLPALSIQEAEELGEAGP